MSNEYVITSTDITKLHIQTKLLMQKSKNAALGEMVASIAHQWRQPLGSLALLIQNIEDDYDEQLVDRQYLQNFIDKNMKLINYLSQTIDDFRNFFKPDNELTKFSIKKVIENICSIQKPQLLKYQIDVQIIGNDFVVDGFENEFGQVVINLINNSIDAMVENSVHNGKIFVILGDKKIVVKDNGGGIPENIINKIFDAYYSTKSKNGTGLGLYMSKIIIEDHMKGKLSVSNDENGAKFLIEFGEK